jgi:NAD(P)-dependent dehydrogenase (short-subunit alcohol dehydrogenase family)
MDLQISGKRALVTGSSSGIGAAIAGALAAEGVSVVVHGRDTERTRAVAGEITRAGGVAHAVTTDLTNDAAAQTLNEFIEAKIGGIDILVNNAGGRPKGWQRDGWLGQGSHAWRDTYELNVLATARMVDTFTPAMVKRGWGRIIQIASAIALHQPPNFPDYQAAKAAEINLTRSLSRALAGTGVTSNSIACGIIHTPGSHNELNGVVREVGLGDDWQPVERRLALEVFRQTVGRVGRGRDIAATAAFLASPLADFITGVNIVVDGGI